jgi:hypothetical protein
LVVKLHNLLLASSPETRFNSTGWRRCSWDRFMRPAAVDSFIRTAEPAETAFHSLNEPEESAALLAAGPSADQAMGADLAQGFIDSSGLVSGRHVNQR